MAVKMLTYKVESNVQNNRLELFLKGHISKEGLNSFYNELKLAVADLADGFDVLTDLRECEFSSLDSIEIVRKIKGFLVENNAKSVVRIVNEKQLVYRQILNYELMHNGIKNIYVKTREEAEEEFNKTVQRDGIRFKMINHGIDYTVGIQNKIGTLLDISTTGCAIKAADTLPELSEKICLTIQFNSHDDLMNSLTCSAETIRVDGDVFAVKFDNLDQVLINSLHERLIHECSKKYSVAVS